MKSDYSEKTNEKLLRALLVVAALFYIPLAYYGEDFFKYYITHDWLRVLYVIFALSGLFVVMERDYYLPFLGDTVFPDGILGTTVTPTGANIQHTLTNLPKHTKIVYWAAEPCELTETCGVERMPWEAYSDYTNAGTAMSDSNGTARVSIRGKPQRYNVPYKSKLILPHIHYRYRKNNGMYSRILTTYV